MKKLISASLAALLCAAPIAMTSCGGANTTITEPRATYDRSLEGTTLNVFNWGVYLSDGSEGSLDVNAAF